jgi:TctA family transporter
MHQFKGDWTVFFQRPISLVFLLAALLGALWPVIHNHLQKKNMSEGDK